jgi:hypothetical protein
MAVTTAWTVCAHVLTVTGVCQYKLIYLLFFPLTVMRFIHDAEYDLGVTGIVCG